MTKTEVKIPDWTGKETTILDNHIIFVEIETDLDPENPCENWDGFGMIRSLSNRHINSIDYDEAKQILEDDPDAVALSYFEHGLSSWMVAGLPAPAGVEFQWDGVRFAGIWIPDDCVRESYQGQDGLSRRDWMVKQAESACETYTQWCNGDVYGYNVEAYELRKDDDGEPYDVDSDCRRETPVFEDSCWGFYGIDSVKEEVAEAVECALNKIRE